MASARMKGFFLATDASARSSGPRRALSASDPITSVGPSRSSAASMAARVSAITGRAPLINST